MFGPKLFGSSNPANVRARIHILEGIWRLLSVWYPESSWIICVSVSNTWLIWIINMLAKCLNVPETWQMCFFAHEMISDFRFHCCFIPEVFRPWTVVETNDSGGAQNPGAACEGAPASQAHSLLWLMIKHQMKCINHKSTDLPVPILNSMKFYPNQKDVLLPTMIRQCPFSSSTRIWASSMRWLISRCLIDRPYFSHI